MEYNQQERLKKKEWMSLQFSNTNVIQAKQGNNRNTVLL